METAAAETLPADAGPMLRLTATSANVTGAPDSIRIDLFRWSTDAERDSLMAAWELKTVTVGRGGAAGRGGGRGGRGGGGAATGTAAGGARGRGRAGAAPDGGAAGGAATPTPEAQLAQALKEAPTIGYLWSSEAAGYAVRYAGSIAQPDGADRIILITDRRLGEANGLWRAPNQGALNQGVPAPYDFSVIELRIGAKGTGEGKLSLGEKLAADAAAGIVTMTEYDSLPVVFTGLKRTTPAAQGGRSNERAK